MSHTPGPWTYTPCHFEDARGYIFMEKATGACTIHLTGAASMTQRELDAHGCLLAAAPTMLDALKYVVRYHREHDSGEGELFGLDFVTTCIAAIHEAEGRT